MQKGEKMSKAQRKKTSKGLLGHKVSVATKKKISKSLTGFRHTKETRIRMSGRSGRKSPFWKGDEVGYWGVHQWIIQKRGKPRYCEYCKRTDEKRYEWANKDHKYRRRIRDFMRLCQRCHVKYDKKFNNKYAKRNSNN